MGLILDTSTLIAAERRGASVDQLLQTVQTVHGETEAALSSVSIVELTHGVYRALTPTSRQKRRAFVNEVYRSLIVHPLTSEIAELAGRIEGEQAMLGNRIELADLIIGATALSLDFAVATLNEKHFRRIPGLPVIGL